ncbi:hypothetical protein FF36_01595 [Frankia torreyi]|uniref:Uncharacterized protein n=1 Tax=Frankia torreyi TaxID=1856 RepID=A0A0D8BLB3_9ACTN|nr:MULTISPECIES: hypothetical protein [Frankia]KJE24192.1 hypothetical protein FF36_01595 [Frankia torreyi]KQM06109.1 hypothetical protein FF86_1011134 [Frankia sp. CpI1-P]
MPGHRPASFGPFPAEAGTNGFPPVAAPGRDDALPVPNALTAPAPDRGRSASLPGLLPGLPPQGADSSEPATSGAGEGALRTGADRTGADRNADRNKVLVDRRLLIGGGGLLLALVIVFGVLAFTGGKGSGGESVTAAAQGRPAGAGTATAAPGTAGRAGGNPRDVLRSLLNPAVMTGCADPGRSDSAYADATLLCKTPSGMEVTAFHFPNRSALDRQIGARETFYTDEGNCDDGQQSSERWSSPAEATGGNRLCYFFANRFYEFWTYDDHLIAFSADDPTAARMNDWWHSFDPLRR